MPWAYFGKCLEAIPRLVWTPLVLHELYSSREALVERMEECRSCEGHNAKQDHHVEMSSEALALSGQRSCRFGQIEFRLLTWSAL